MNIVEIILVSIGVSMDAFTVATCKGLAMKKMDWAKSIIIATYFGTFQFLMPVIGYFLSAKFQGSMQNIDHWIVFILLTAIGFNMIKELWSSKDEEEQNNSVSFKTMIIASIATSIDALAIGITFSVLENNIFISSICIGIIAFLFSLLGVKIGNIFGSRYEKKAQLLGGVILILLGIKILLNHLNIL